MFWASLPLQSMALLRGRVKAILIGFLAKRLAFEKRA
jgi:hypothetical protein